MLLDFDTLNMNDKFYNIRPYNDAEAVQAIAKLFGNQEFVNSLSFLSDQFDIDELVEIAKNCKSIFDFQNQFSGKIYNYFIEKSTSSIHFSGMENINSNSPYLFIANHRDIVLDSSSLQRYFFDNNLHGTKSAIGDNLITGPFFVELARINNMLLVLRSSSIHEKIANLHLLSEYIHHSIFEDKESVWIAQRSGRTKDGYDKTQQGLIKMLSMAKKRDPMECLKELRLTPVTISYEFESCDQLKAREMALSENGEYIKKPGEDFKSIVQGVLGYKGEIRLHIGTPIIDEIDSIDKTLKANDQLNEVTKLVDQQIHANFYLYKNNYVAYDFQEQSTEFESFYSQQDKEKFLKYLKEKSIIDDVNAEKMMHHLLQIYANPVRSKYGKPIKEKHIES